MYYFHTAFLFHNLPFWLLRHGRLNKTEKADWLMSTCWLDYFYVVKKIFEGTLVLTLALVLNIMKGHTHWFIVHHIHLNLILFSYSFHMIIKQNNEMITAGTFAIVNCWAISSNPGTWLYMQRLILFHRITAANTCMSVHCVWYSKPCMICNKEHNLTETIWNTHTNGKQEKD